MEENASAIRRNSRGRQERIAIATMKRTTKIPLLRVRPFSPLWEMVNNFDWWAQDIKHRRVRIDRLIATQASVQMRGNPISLVKIGRRLYIRDGHHRVVRAILKSRKIIQAHVVEV